MTKSCNAREIGSLLPPNVAVESPRGGVSS